jgi:lipoic acid synthetase
MLPEWLTIRPASTEKYSGVKSEINRLGLHTVCAEAHCPNITECWSGGTATFMVLGEKCTRGCRFCTVPKSAIGAIVDAEEPKKLGKVISEWKLDYVVITSVCRDDLPDQGSGHFARCVEEIKRASPGTTVEVLIPDFRGDTECLKRIVEAKPDVIGHNIETVKRLTPTMRDRRASYSLSLEVLRGIKALDKTRYTKSALMLGVGESEEEILDAFRDLRGVGTDFIAIGQYLRPSPRHIEVKEYVRPEKFDKLKNAARDAGFLYAASGPFVRSSYKAGEFFIKAMVEKRAAESAGSD